MISRLLHATSFKKVLELCGSGDVEEARALLEKLQNEYVSLCDENRVLKRQLHEVAEVLDLSESMEFDGQKYWLVDDFERKGPYCQLCYERDDVLIRLQERTNAYKCLSCGNIFPKPGKQAEPEIGYQRIMNRVIPLFGK